MSAMEIPKSYRKPLAIAIALHIAIVIFLIIKLPSSGFQYHSGHHQTQMVHATAISSSDVKRAMHDIQNREQRQQREEQQRLAKLRHQAQVEKEHQRQAAARVARMKQEQLQLKQQHQQQLHKLAVLKQKQQQLEKLAKEQAVKVAKAKAKALAAAKQKQRILAAKQQALQKKLMAQELAGESKELQQLQTKRMNGIIDKYKAMILAAIGQNWLVPGGANKNLSSIFEIQLGPGGVVVSVKLIKSSGNQALDQSAQTAIYKASPLPVPTDPQAFDKFRDVRLTVSPKEIVHS